MRLLRRHRNFKVDVLRARLPIRPVPLTDPRIERSLRSSIITRRSFANQWSVPRSQEAVSRNRKEESGRRPHRRSYWAIAFHLLAKKTIGENEFDAKMRDVNGTCFQPPSESLLDQKDKFKTNRWRYCFEFRLLVGRPMDDGLTRSRRYIFV